MFVRARLIQAEDEDKSPAWLKQMGALATDVKVEPAEDGSFVLRGLLAGRVGHLARTANLTSRGEGADVMHRNLFLGSQHGI